MHQSNATDSSPERSQPIESAAGKHQEDPTAGETSDSGDSLFITQKEIPSPVRAARRHRHGKGPGLTYSKWLEESDVESSSSSSQEESGSHRRTTRRKSSLPVYTFSALADNGSDGSLPSQKNRVLHTFAVAGFFKCLSEFDTKTSSPTVDADEEDISPLSEEEEEQPHTEDFRVVDKMCFVAALKARSCRSWCSQRKRPTRMNAGCAGEKALRENGLKMQENIDAEASARTNVPLWERGKSSDNAVNSSKVLGGNENKPTPPPDIDGGGEVCNQTQGEEKVDTRGHGTPLQSICVDTRIKEKKKKKKNAQIHANMEGQRREEATPQTPPQSPDQTESNERGLRDEEAGGQEERTSREHRTRKKRKGRSKTANTLWDEQEPDVTVTDFMTSLEAGGGKERKKEEEEDVRQFEQSSTTDGAKNDAEGIKLKRKKNKKDGKMIPAKEREESVKCSGRGLALVDLSHPESVGEGTNALDSNTPDTRRSAEDQSPKPAKKKKHRREVKMETSADGASQGDFPLAAWKTETRSASSVPCADAVEKEVQTGRNHTSAPAGDLGTPSAEIAGNLEQTDGRVKKKNRKRKHDYKDDVERERGRNGTGLGTATERMERAAVLGPLTKKGKEDSCCMSEEPSTHVGPSDGFFKQVSHSQTPGKRPFEHRNSKMEPNSSADLLKEQLVTYLELRKKKKEHTTTAPLASQVSFSESKISSPGCIVSKKRKKLKRKLYHPVQDLLE